MMRKKSAFLFYLKCDKIGILDRPDGGKFEHEQKNYFDR